MYGGKNMIHEKWLDKKYLKWCLILFSLMIIVLPMIFRFIIFDQHIVPHLDTYGDMLTIKELSQSSNSITTLSEYNLYHYSIYSIYTVFKQSNLELIMLLVPIILGVLSMLFWYGVLESTSLTPLMKHTSSFILFLSPIFIYIFTVSSFLTLLFFLTLLTLFLLTKKHSIVKYAALMPLFLTGMLSTYVPLLICIFYWYKAYKEQRRVSIKPKWFLYTITIIAGITAFFSVFVFKAYNISLHPLENMNLFQNNITDLGAVLGFGVFTLVLFLVGFYYVIKEKNNIFMFIFIILLLAILSYHFAKYRLLLNSILILCAGYGFTKLYVRKWDIAFLKSICLFMLVLGVIFSGLSFVNRIIHMPPSVAEIEQLKLLKEDTSEGKVLSHEENGFVIDYYVGENKAFLDKRTINTYNREAANTLFHSRNVDMTLQLLEEHGIKYLFITDKMKTGQVWKKNNEGLLFLLEKSEKFKRIYTTPSVDIWESRG